MVSRRGVRADWRASWCQNNKDCIPPSTCPTVVISMANRYRFVLSRYQPVIWPSAANTSSIRTTMESTSLLIFGWPIRFQPAKIRSFKPGPERLLFARIYCLIPRQQFSIGERSGEPAVLKKCFRPWLSFQACRQSVRLSQAF